MTPEEMTARKSADAQAEILDAAEAALREHHILRASRLLTDCERLGPMTPEHATRAEALDGAIQLEHLNHRFYVLCQRCGIVPPIGAGGPPSLDLAA